MYYTIVILYLYYMYTVDAGSYDMYIVCADIYLYLYIILPGSSQKVMETIKLLI